MYIKQFILQYINHSIFFTILIVWKKKHKTHLNQNEPKLEQKQFYKTKELMN